MVWSLEEFADMDLSTKSLILSCRSRRPHKINVVALPDEGICSLNEQQFELPPPRTRFPSLHVPAWFSPSQLLFD